MAYLLLSYNNRNMLLQSYLHNVCLTGYIYALMTHYWMLVNELQRIVFIAHLDAALSITV